MELSLANMSISNKKPTLSEFGFNISETISHSPKMYPQSNIAQTELTDQKEDGFKKESEHHLPTNKFEHKYQSISQENPYEKTFKSGIPTDNGMYLNPDVI